MKTLEFYVILWFQVSYLASLCYFRGLFSYLRRWNRKLSSSPWKPEDNRCKINVLFTPCLSSQDNAHFFSQRRLLSFIWLNATFLDTLLLEVFQVAHIKELLLVFRSWFIRCWWCCCPGETRSFCFLRSHFVQVVERVWLVSGAEEKRQKWERLMMQRNISGLTLAQHLRCKRFAW